MTHVQAVKRQEALEEVEAFSINAETMWSVNATELHCGTAGVTRAAVHCICAGALIYLSLIFEQWPWCF